MLALSPKNDEAKELGTKVENLEAELSQHQAEANAAAEAREGFSADYQQLVSLGKAVPGDDDTPSLIVQLNRIAKRSHVKFETFVLAGEQGGQRRKPQRRPARKNRHRSPPTEAAASLMPLGATIGPAGLGVMPYTLKFEGDFFQLADFIHGLDSMVKTTNSNVGGRRPPGHDRRVHAQSRLRSGLPEAAKRPSSVTTYVTPP